MSEFTPQEPLSRGTQYGVQAAAIGVLVSALRNALGNHTHGAMGVFTRTGGIIGMFGALMVLAWVMATSWLTWMIAAVGFTYAATESAVANVREKDDPLNGATGACAAAFLAGISGASRQRSSPAPRFYLARSQIATTCCDRMRCHRRDSWLLRPTRQTQPRHHRDIARETEKVFQEPTRLHCRFARLINCQRIPISVEFKIIGDVVAINTSRIGFASSCILFWELSSPCSQPSGVCFSCSLCRRVFHPRPHFLVSAKDPVFPRGLVIRS